jgi:hypothetical protein
MSRIEDDPDGSSLAEEARGGGERVADLDVRREVDGTECRWGVCCVRCCRECCTDAA